MRNASSGRFLECRLASLSTDAPARRRDLQAASQPPLPLLVRSERQTLRRLLECASDFPALLHLPLQFNSINHNRQILMGIADCDRRHKACCPARHRVRRETNLNAVCADVLLHHAPQPCKAQALAHPLPESVSAGPSSGAPATSPKTRRCKVSLLVSAEANVITACRTSP